MVFGSDGPLFSNGSHASAMTIRSTDRANMSHLRTVTNNFVLLFSWCPMGVFFFFFGVVCVNVLSLHNQTESLILSAVR
jgi:hypothetical protein